MRTILIILIILIVVINMAMSIVIHIASGDCWELFLTDRTYEQTLKEETDFNIYGVTFMKYYIMLVCPIGSIIHIFYRLFTMEVAETPVKEPITADEFLLEVQNRSRRNINGCYTYNDLCKIYSDLMNKNNGSFGTF